MKNTLTKTDTDSSPFYWVRDDEIDSSVVDSLPIPVRKCVLKIMKLVLLAAKSGRETPLFIVANTESGLVVPVFWSQFLADYGDCVKTARERVKANLILVVDEDWDSDVGAITFGLEADNAEWISGAQVSMLDKSLNTRTFTPTPFIKQVA